MLSFEASGRLRDQMLGELNDIGSEDEAAKWAHRRLPDKNKLNADDAKHIETMFRAKLKSFAIHHADGLPSVGERFESHIVQSSRSSPASEADAPDQNGSPVESRSTNRFWSHPEPRRIRDRDHVRFVAQQPCLICGRQPSDAHHLRFAQSRALGRKASDEFTVPLCRGHHRELHRRGDEAAWWNTVGIDPTMTARALWLEMHPLPKTEPRSTAAEPSG